MIQLDFVGEISDNIVNMGANGAETPPPPNHEGEVTSIMTSTNYSTTTTLHQSRKTYPQDWTAYNAAQTSEKTPLWCFWRTCASTSHNPNTPLGRPRFPLADMVHTGATKVYSGFSARRFDCDVRQAFRQGLISAAPTFSTVNRYIANQDLTPVITDLIERSAEPLSVVESDFSGDSNGFSTCRFDRWFDHKWGKEKAQRQWQKAHIVTGAKTNIVTSVQWPARPSGVRASEPGRTNELPHD